MTKLEPRNFPKTDIVSKHWLTISTESNSSDQQSSDSLESLPQQLTKLNLAPRKSQFGYISWALTWVTTSTVSMPSTLLCSNSTKNLWEQLPNFSTPATSLLQPPPPTSQLYTVTATSDPITNTAYDSDSLVNGKHQMFYGEEPGTVEWFYFHILAFPLQHWLTRMHSTDTTPHTSFVSLCDCSCSILKFC